MGWPKGKKRKEVAGAPVRAVDALDQLTNLIESPYTLKTKLVLRVDKIMDGPFAGLYQLVTIEETGKETVVMDANTKRYVIMRMHKLFMAVN